MPIQHAKVTPHKEYSLNLTPCPKFTYFHKLPFHMIKNAFQSAKLCFTSLSCMLRSVENGKIAECLFNMQKFNVIKNFCENVNHFWSSDSCTKCHFTWHKLLFKMANCVFNFPSHQPRCHETGKTSKCLFNMQKLHNIR